MVAGGERRERHIDSKKTTVEIEQPAVFSTAGMGTPLAGVATEPGSRFQHLEELCGIQAKMERHFLSTLSKMHDSLNFSTAVLR